MSWKPQVLIDGSNEDWTDNCLRFATKSEAEAYVEDLYSRWSLVVDTRVVKSKTEPNYRWISGRLVSIEYQDPFEVEVNRSQAMLEKLFGKEELMK